MTVIFHGIVGGMDDRNGIGDTINLLDCAKTIKYNILSTYDCDIFIHSWSLEHKEEIVSLYKPVLSLFEKQEFFGYSEKEISHHIIDGQKIDYIN